MTFPPFDAKEALTTSEGNARAVLHTKIKDAIDNAVRAGELGVGVTIPVASQSIRDEVRENLTAAGYTVRVCNNLYARDWIRNLPDWYISWSTPYAAPDKLVIEAPPEGPANRSTIEGEQPAPVVPWWRRATHRR